MLVHHLNGIRVVFRIPFLVAAGYLGNLVGASVPYT